VVKLINKASISSTPLILALPSNIKIEKIITTGKKYLGTPYKLGATPFKTDKFDCSSFIQYIFAKNGIKLPRKSTQQALYGTSIEFNNLKRGDLLFFYTKRTKGIGHVAIYLGKNKILHACRKKGVSYASLEKWKKKLLLIKRIV